MFLHTHLGFGGKISVGCSSRHKRPQHLKSCVGDTDPSGQNWSDILCRDDMSPTCRRHFRLSHQMRRWRRAGEDLILCLDANENIYLGKLGRELTNLQGLGMKEVVGEFTTRRLGATYF
jgi:hypothetical protein